MQGSRPEDKRITIDGKKKNMLQVLFQHFRDSFNIGETLYPLKADMTKMSVHLCKAICTNPTFVTDSESSYLGKMVVDLFERKQSQFEINARQIYLFIYVTGTPYLYIDNLKIGPLFR